MPISRPPQLCLLLGSVFIWQRIPDSCRLGTWPTNPANTIIHPLLYKSLRGLVHRRATRVMLRRRFVDSRARQLRGLRVRNCSVLGRPASPHLPPRQQSHPAEEQEAADCAADRHAGHTPPGQARAAALSRTRRHVRRGRRRRAHCRHVGCLGRGCSRRGRVGHAHVEVVARAVPVWAPGAQHRKVEYGVFSPGHIPAQPVEADGPDETGRPGAFYMPPWGVVSARGRTGGKGAGLWHRDLPRSFLRN